MSLPVPTDVADYDQVKAAAERLGAVFGPIGVWINVAFTSVFADSPRSGPSEFKRVAEVAYLGFVYGTHVAVSWMVPHDRGTIVQVGSALGSCGIPLKAAYWRAKPVVNGFTESIRTELIRGESNLRIAIAQMPAVNTPQLSWGLSQLPNHPPRVSPIYQLEVAACSVVCSADLAQRKQSSVCQILGQKIAAPLRNVYLARAGLKSEQTGEKAGRSWGNGPWEPGDEAGGRDQGARGVFGNRSHGPGPQLWFSHHARETHAGTATVGVGELVAGAT
jgi:NAD(P)-dependent dehydrogenase (short-subunit alcohol dehydrogenase family)